MGRPHFLAYGGRVGYCPHNGVSLSLKPTKQTLCIKTSSNTIFLFSSNQKTGLSARQMIYSANLGNASSLFCSKWEKRSFVWEKVPTIGLYWPSLSFCLFASCLFVLMYYVCIHSFIKVMYLNPSGPALL